MQGREVPQVVENAGDQQHRKCAKQGPIRVKRIDGQQNTEAQSCENRRAAYQRNFAAMPFASARIVDQTGAPRHPRKYLHEQQRNYENQKVFGELLDHRPTLQSSNNVLQAIIARSPRGAGNTDQPGNPVFAPPTMGFWLFQTGAQYSTTRGCL